MNRFLFVWGMGVLPLFCLAKDAYWEQTKKGVYEFTNETYWAEQYVPTNAGDVARFEKKPEGEIQVMLPNANFEVKPVQGSEDYIISTHRRTWNGTAVLNYTLLDPSGFLGTWKTADALHRWILPAAGAVKPTMGKVAIKNRPYFQVPEAGSVAKIGCTVDAGELDKEGKGTLEIERLGDPLQTRIRIMGGEVALNGFPAERGVPDQPVEGAYLHLDASASVSLTTETREDGRTYVTEWRDVRGNGKTATVDNTFHTAPFLSETAIVNGTPLIDFGAYWNKVENPHPEADIAALGPSAALSFPRSAKIREAFVVFEDTQRSNTCAFFFGDRSTFHFHRQMSPNGLFDGNASLAVRNGVSHLNNVEVPFWYEADYSRLNAVHISTTGDTTIGTLGNDRGIRSGGIRIAELLLYEHPLTAAEQEQNNLYLMKKWQIRSLLPVLSFEEDTAAVSVPKDRVLPVDKAMVARKLTKKGEGTLQINHFEGNQTAMRIDGGSVEFLEKTAAPALSAPAAKPDLWLDASVEESMTAGAGESAGDISRWSDRRPEKREGNYAVLSDSVETCPTVAGNTANGLPVVDFGYGWKKESGRWPTNAQDSSAMKLVVSDNNHFYRDAYIVLRMKRKQGANESNEYQTPNIFGSSQQDFTRWNTESLLARFAWIDVLAGLWCCDGKFVDPEKEFPFGTNEFWVVSYSGKGGTIDRLAEDRGIQRGGVQIAEMLLYHRNLSLSERENTQAYLLNKWKALPHPSAEPGAAIASLSFGSAAEPLLRTEQPLSIGTIALKEHKTLRKTGKGSAAVNALQIDSLDTLTVEEGSLDLDITTSYGIQPFLHLDASCPETMDLQVSTDPLGNTVTNVLRWKDVNKNGRFASPVGKNYCTAKPTYRMLETAERIRRPAIDFGEFFMNADPPNGSGHYPTTGTSAAMLFNQGSSKIREAHIIFADGDPRQLGFVFSSRNAYNYHRGFVHGDVSAKGGELFNTHASQCVKNGYIATNGIPCAASTILAPGFQLISVVPTADTTIDAIANDRYIRVGGIQICEMLLFEQPLTPEERGNLQNKLMLKWLGAGQPELDGGAKSIGQVKLSPGSSLSLSSDLPLHATELVGGGTLRCGELSGVSSIRLDADTEPAPLSVNGDLRIEENASLSLDFFGEESFDRLESTGKVTLPVSADVVLHVHPGKGLSPCRLPILSAGELTGASDLGGWQIRFAGCEQISVLGKAVREGDTVYAVLLPIGTLLLLQ